MEQAFRDWDAKDKIFQRELNIHICRKWDELTTEGKHGHYETLLSVCRSAISFWRNRAETESQASADSIREGIQAKQECANLRATNAELLAALKAAIPFAKEHANIEEFDDIRGVATSLYEQLSAAIAKAQAQ